MTGCMTDTPRGSLTHSEAAQGVKHWSPLYKTWDDGVVVELVSYLSAVIEVCEVRQDIPDVKISKPLLTSLTITNSVSLIYLSLKVPISS